jgi:hypothetical protein
MSCSYAGCRDEAALTPPKELVFPQRATPHLCERHMGALVRLAMEARFTPLIDGQQFNLMQEEFFCLHPRLRRLISGVYGSPFMNFITSARGPIESKSAR